MTVRTALRFAFAACVALIACPGHARPVIDDIRTANAATSAPELTAIVRNAAACCSASPEISLALTDWLRENHPIYAERAPSETAQLRGFLLASLGAFPPNERLLGYVRAELTFAADARAVAAAAVAARRMSDSAEELVPLMEPFLGPTFDDETVDVTTPELQYPLAHPTTARREIVRTLVGFGKYAYRAVPLLEAIASCRECGTWSTDAELVRRAGEAATQIREATPPCCRKPPAAAAPPRGLQLVERRERKPIRSASLPLLDQEGKPLRFSDLRGRPFVVAFFYTRCMNPVKCVMTVRRLRELATDCAKDGRTRTAGIFGMTYDPGFDTPQRLRSYGTAQGMPFGPNVRLVKAAVDSGDALRRELDLRVSYGAGTVSQHGIQLFVFDKEGRLAATHDNEVWSVADVRECLKRLVAE